MEIITFSIFAVSSIIIGLYIGTELGNRMNL